MAMKCKDTNFSLLAPTPVLQFQSFIAVLVLHAVSCKYEKIHSWRLLAKQSLHT